MTFWRGQFGAGHFGARHLGVRLFGSGRYGADTLAHRVDSCNRAKNSQFRHNLARGKRDEPITGFCVKLGEELRAPAVFNLFRGSVIEKITVTIFNISEDLSARLLLPDI